MDDENTLQIVIQMTGGDINHEKQDDFIKPHHTQELYEKYAGDKNII